MALGKPSQTPIEPKEGWAEDKFQRCPICKTILIYDTISVCGEGPTIPIAQVIKCLPCNKIVKRWVLPGRYVEGLHGGREYVESQADRLKITKGMIAHCLETMPHQTQFTLQELKAGSTPVKENNKFNPDRFVEPIVDEPLF